MAYLRLFNLNTLVTLVFSVLLLSVHGQSKNLKPKKKVLQLVNESLNQSVKQYQYLVSIAPEDALPRTFEKGRLKSTPSDDWVSGFYPGSLLYLYEFSKTESFYTEAVKRLKLLEKEQFNKGLHDLGFMMYCSFGNALRINPLPEYPAILVNSAKSLCSRFNPKVGCIRSWDPGPSRTSENDYLVIIDNMMNLELLFWATRNTGDSSYYNIAETHANTTLNNHFRPDYSSYHVVNYNPVTGTVQKRRTQQGAADESAWARGQAWGLYGYTLMFRETGDRKYLEQASRIADFILNHPNLPEDKIPYWDFNAPGIPNTPRDASAGAITGAALIELAGYMDKRTGRKYMAVAEKIITSLSSPNYRAPYKENGGFILMHSVGSFPHKGEVDVPLNYADYYYIEAMMRYKSLAGRNGKR